jgi:hypothetical protein
VVTTGIWQTFPVEDFQPYGTQFQRRDPKRILALPRNVLDELPRGSTIVAPERHGGPNKTWLVADLDRLEADHWRAIVTERLT